MKNKIKNNLCILLLVLTIFTLSGCDTNTTQQTGDIAILYTGDVHCAVDDNIGYAGLKSFENELIADGMSTLIVDTGDALQGDALGTLTEGTAIVEIMNEVGYDALALGNHEFDYGADTLIETSAMADFPFLSVNFTDTDEDALVFEPYVIKEQFGVKIAFVGISTPLSQTKSSPSNFMDETGETVYNFLQDSTGDLLWEAVQQAIDSAQEEGADYIIALSHLGIAELDAPYNSYTLIENTEGIDVVLEGHSHVEIEGERVRNKLNEFVILSSTGSHMENIGFLLIEEDGNFSTGLVNQQESKDVEIEALISDINEEFEEILSVVVGEISDPLVDSDPSTEEYIIRKQETNLGNLVADSIRYVADSDIAFINSGGVRAPISAGEATYEDILAVMPFNNGICKITATGQEILDALEHSAYDLSGNSGSFLQVSGVTFSIDSTLESSLILDEDGMFVEVSGPYRVHDVSIQGAPLDLEQAYTIASIGYILKYSGSGYSMFADNELLQDDFILDYDAFIQYLTQEYANNPDTYKNPFGEGRITIK